MTYLPLNDEQEREAVRVALATCFYLASDEARDLRRELADGSVADDDRPAAEANLQLAELRRMRYSELHDRLLAMSPPQGPNPSGPMSRHFIGDGTWKVVSE